MTVSDQREELMILLLLTVNIISWCAFPMKYLDMQWMICESPSGKSSLVSFYWIILENAHHITGSCPRIIYCITLKLTAELHFPSFCIHVMKNGFKCPRCVAEQQSLKVSAFACQNQLFHHSSSQQC